MRDPWALCSLLCEPLAPWGGQHHLPLYGRRAGSTSLSRHHLPLPTAPAGAAGGSAATGPAWAPVWPTGTATSSPSTASATASRGAASTHWHRYAAPPRPGPRCRRWGRDHDPLLPAQDYCAGSDAANGTFRIVTENVPCGTTGVTCSKAIKIFLGVREPGSHPLRLQSCQSLRRGLGPPDHSPGS